MRHCFDDPNSYRGRQVGELDLFGDEKMTMVVFVPKGI
jgi:hypothetical protein